MGAILLASLLGAVACTLLAMTAKPLNLGLFENIALGAVSAGAATAGLSPVLPNLLARLPISAAIALGMMACVGAWLNARAR